MRVLWWVVASFMVLGFELGCSHEPEQRGVVMNQFIAADKLAGVRICATTSNQLVNSFGAPNGQGRDGDMATMSWSALAIVTQPGEAAVGTQMVQAWIDPDGLVAGFVVNPTSMPTKPAPCREQKPATEPADPAPQAAPSPKKTEA